MAAKADYLQKLTAMLEKDKKEGIKQKESKSKKIPDEIIAGGYRLKKSTIKHTNKTIYRDVDLVLTNEQPDDKKPVLCTSKPPEIKEKLDVVYKPEEKFLPDTSQETQKYINTKLKDDTLMQDIVPKNKAKIASTKQEILNELKQQFKEV